MKGLYMKYFVLKPTTKDEYGKASIKAIRTYSSEIFDINQEFAIELNRWMMEIEEKDIKD